MLLSVLSLQIGLVSPVHADISPMRIVSVVEAQPTVFKTTLVIEVIDKSATDCASAIRKYAGQYPFWLIRMNETGRYIALAEAKIDTTVTASGLSCQVQLGSRGKTDYNSDRTTQRGPAVVGLFSNPDAKPLFTIPITLAGSQPTISLEGIQRGDILDSARKVTVSITSPDNVVCTTALPCKLTVYGYNSAEISKINEREFYLSSSSASTNASVYVKVYIYAEGAIPASAYLEMQGDVEFTESVLFQTMGDTRISTEIVGWPSQIVAYAPPIPLKFLARSAGKPVIDYPITFCASDRNLCSPAFSGTTPRTDATGVAIVELDSVKAAAAAKYGFVGDKALEVIEPEIALFQYSENGQKTLRALGSGPAKSQRASSPASKCSLVIEKQTVKGWTIVKRLDTSNGSWNAPDILEMTGVGNGSYRARTLACTWIETRQKATFTRSGSPVLKTSCNQDINGYITCRSYTYKPILVNYTSKRVKVSLPSATSPIVVVQN